MLHYKSTHNHTEGYMVKKNPEGQKGFMPECCPIHSDVEGFSVELINCSADLVLKQLNGVLIIKKYMDTENQ